MRLTRITKSFGATRAVDDVSLEIAGGEILALAGENGAGKTTLMRIAAGELRPDAGRVDAEGGGDDDSDAVLSEPTAKAPGQFRNDTPLVLSWSGGRSRPPGSRDEPTAEAAAAPQGRREDVGFVHQHFLLVPELTIAENLAVAESGLRFATRRRLEKEAIETIARTGIELRDVHRRVAELSVGEKSKLELIKAIAKKPSTLILDEPTSVLTPSEAEELFRVMRTLAANGTAIVFISHKLPEVLSIAQRVVVMRSGRIVLDTRSATAGQLAAAMTQSPLPAPKRESATRGPLAYEHGDVRLHQNEILAIVGVAGNGQAELARELRDRLPRAAHIPEDRTRDGIIAEMSIAENLALRGVSSAVIPLYSIRAQDARQRAGDLSGGNQQKLILARELDAHPQIIIAAEPTRGLDLEATAFVHDKLRAAAAAGSAILLITSDLDEAFELAGALQVMYRGRLSERMTPEQASQRVAGLMGGLA